jgi:hypothetical protein
MALRLGEGREVEIKRSFSSLDSATNRERNTDASSDLESDDGERQAILI